MTFLVNFPQVRDLVGTCCPTRSQALSSWAPTPARYFSWKPAIALAASRRPLPRGRSECPDGYSWWLSISEIVLFRETACVGQNSAAPLSRPDLAWDQFPASERDL